MDKDWDKLQNASMLARKKMILSYVYLICNDPIKPHLEMRGK